MYFVDKELAFIDLIFNMIHIILFENLKLKTTFNDQYTRI